MLAEPLPYRTRGIAGELDGELIGVGGLALLPSGVWGAYVHLKPEARNYPVALHKAAKLTLGQAKLYGISRVVAYAEEGIEPAKRWLARLGFEPQTIDGHEVYIWHS
jgi:hypothetical protein